MLKDKRLLWLPFLLLLILAVYLCTRPIALISEVLDTGLNASNSQPVKKIACNELLVLAFKAAAVYY